MKFYQKQILAAMCITISFADCFEIIFDPFKGKQSKWCVLLVRLKPSLFDHLTRTARQDMKALDGELHPQESAAWSEQERMKQVQTPRNLCNNKYPTQNQLTSPLAVGLCADSVACGRE